MTLFFQQQQQQQQQEEEEQEEEQEQQEQESVRDAAHKAPHGKQNKVRRKERATGHGKSFLPTLSRPQYESRVRT